MTASRTVFGPGSLARLRDLIDAISPPLVLLVTGRDSYESCGASGVLTPSLKKHRVHRLEAFRPNPQIDDLDQLLSDDLLKSARTGPPPLLVAVGGGSVIDMAKLLAFMAPQTAKPREIATGYCVPDQNAWPLIAIPTTSGTGSEATHFSVLYVDNIKHSIVHESMRPAFVIIDPELTYSLPERLTAITAMDAFCQAVESYWSVKSTDQSRKWASTAAAMVLNHVDRAVNEPDPASRAALSEAAHLSGRAIDITRTTAPHALSYTLTALHGIPHGHAVVLFLGPVLEFNAGITASDCHDPRGVPFVLERVKYILDLLGASTAAEGRKFLDRKLDSLGLETRLETLGVTRPVELEGIVASVNSDRLRNNPRRLEPDQLRSIVDSIA